MGDQGGGFDPCECFNFHEVAMRRLLNMLRQSQSYCTDSECVDNITGSSVQSGNEEGVFLISVMLVMAFLMFYLSPNVFRSRSSGNEKPRLNQRDSNGEPPTPPPSSC